MVMELELNKEQELLLACARSNMEPQLHEKVLSRDVDWNRLMDLADRHGLKPLLYWHLQGLLPAEVEKELKLYFERNAQKNLMMQGELLRLLKIFNSQGIKVIPYKGPILSLEVYGNLALREFGDLDFFVNQEDVEDVKRILISQSYRPEVDLEPSREQKFLETQRELGFIHSDTSIPVEVHWAFQDLFLSLPCDLWDGREAVIIEFNGVQVVQPSPEDLLLIISLHNASHRWSRISWIVDLAELVKAQDMDWDRVVYPAKNLGVEKILLVNLALAEDLLGLEVPAPVKERCGSYQLTRLVKRIEKKILFENEESPRLRDEVSYNYQLRDSSLYGIKDVVRGLTTPTLYEWKHLQLPPSLFPLYYLLRPIFLIRRHKL